MPLIAILWDLHPLSLAFGKQHPGWDPSAHRFADHVKKRQRGSALQSAQQSAGTEGGVNRVGMRWEGWVGRGACGRASLRPSTRADCRAVVFSAFDAGALLRLGLM